MVDAHGRLPVGALPELHQPPPLQFGGLALPQPAQRKNDRKQR